MLNKTFRFGLSFVVVGLLPGLVSGQASSDDWTLERMEWAEPVEELRAVTVSNRYGAIRVNGTSGDLAGRAELHGMAQYHADDPRKPVLESHVEDGTLSLEITYPNDAEVIDPPDAWRKRRIDITVYVDQSASLRLETLHGGVVVRGYSGPVEVLSESGDVEIKAEGPLRVLSRYGAIETFYQSTDLSAPLSLETLTGAILLTLPWAAQPSAVLETRGELSSDYSIDVEWLPESTEKRGTVGTASDVAAGQSQAPEPILLRSNQGNIRLLRRIDDRRSAPPETGTSTATSENR